MTNRNVLGNLKLLKKDMENRGWKIDSFLFTYNHQDFIVLVKLYSENEKIPDYALVKLEFLKQDNIADKLLIPANSAILMVEAKILREYFNIKYSDNLGSILKQFNERLAASIPTEVNENKNEAQKNAMVISLSNSDGENPNKIYCYKVKRNPKKLDGTLGRRSPYNDNKTRILRPILYERLRNETNLSFCYSENPDEGKSDEIIIYNWTRSKW